MAAARKGKDKDSLALFADELKAHRAARGWTQADVAAKTSYSESLIAQVEARFKAASPELAKALDRVFTTPGFTEDDGGEPGTFGRIVVRLRNLPFPASFRSFATYEAGGHTGLLGAFSVAEMGNRDAIVFVEDIADGRVFEDDATLSQVALRFKALQSEALPKGASRDLIAKAAEEWTEQAP
jgi:transcriptional regulator with XRE-family HTH domain